MTKQEDFIKGIEERLERERLSITDIPRDTSWTEEQKEGYNLAWNYGLPNIEKYIKQELSTFIDLEIERLEEEKKDKTVVPVDAAHAFLGYDISEPYNSAIQSQIDHYKELQRLLDKQE